MATQTLTQRTAARMRTLLEKRKMTQEQLSEATGIPMRTLSRRLHKVNPTAPDIEELNIIANALGVTLADLVANRQARVTSQNAKAAA